MSFLKAVTNAIKTSVTQAAPSAPRPSRPTSLPSVAVVRDAFEQLPRAKVDLGGRADLATGVHVKLGVAGHEVAAFGMAARGVSVTSLGTTVGYTREGGVGVSTQVLGTKVGVHFVQRQDEAMLGGVNLKHGGREITVGLTPAAPAPLPLPTYVGPDRNDEEV